MRAECRLSATIEQQLWLLHLSSKLAAIRRHDRLAWAMRTAYLSGVMIVTTRSRDHGAIAPKWCDCTRMAETSLIKLNFTRQGENSTSGGTNRSFTP